MANHMTEVAKMLGVELGEEFMCTNGYKYILKEDGIIESQYSDDDRFSISGFSSTLNALLNGKLDIIRKPWKPKYGDSYYFVDIDGYIYSDEYDKNCYADVILYKIGNCYRTCEEAEANRDKWVAFYASDEVLEVIK